MMATCRDIITRAMRKAKIIAIGEEPEGGEAQDALLELQSLYEHWFTRGMFGRIVDITTGEDYEALPNERITATDGAAVTLPATVDDDGEEFPPYDLSFVEVVDIDAQEVTRYVYESGAWVNITELELDDLAPLAGRGMGGLSACLALVLADEYGGQVGPTIMRQAASFKTALALKYGGDAQRTAPDYF